MMPAPRRRRQRAALVLAAVLVLALVLAACTGDDDRAGPTTSRPEPAPPTTAPPDPPADATTTTAPPVSDEAVLAHVAGLPPMPLDVAGLLDASAVEPAELTFASATPFDDLVYTLLTTTYVEGETSGYDTFLPVDPGDERPGAGEVRIVNAVSNPPIDWLYQGSRGDRIILGLPGTAPFFVSPGDGADDDYAVVTNLDVANSVIQLSGAPSDYRLVFGEEGAGAATIGWYLVHVGGGEPDLVAFVLPCDDPVIPGRGGTAGAVPGVPEDVLCGDDGDLDLDDPTRFTFVDAPDDDPVLASGLLQDGTAGTEIVSGVTVDSRAGVYLFGAGDGNLDGGADEPDHEVFVARYDADGTPIWVTEVATLDGGLLFDAVTDDEHLYAVGRTFGALSGFESGGVWDGIILKLRLDTGEIVATDQWGNSGIDGYGAVALDDAGHLYVSGAGSPPGGEIDPTGAGDPFFVLAKHSTDTLGNVWRVLDPALPDSDFVAEAWSGVSYLPGDRPGAGWVVTGGWFRSPGTGADGFVARYGELDQPEPTRESTFVVGSEGLRADWVFDHAAGPDGALYVVGATTGALTTAPAGGDGDAYVLRLDGSLGSPTYVQVATAGADLFDEVVVADDGTVYAVGYSYGDLGGANADPAGRTGDVVVVSFDAQLRELASTRIGTPGEERAGIALDGDTLVVGGLTEGSLVGASAGSFDAFAVRLDRRTLEPVAG
jgi:hypothetical protein